jgi:predicted GIY-YIG superfamily endonuclease/lambda repressor-like predicted transcriptional regulator
MKNFFVYMYLNNDDIVEYIGKTINLPQRIQQHTSDKLAHFTGRIYYYRCHSLTEMNSYEYFLIRKYKPQYNDLLDGEDTIQIDDPKWIEFNKNDFMPVRENKPCTIAKEGDGIRCIETGIEYISTRAAERDTQIPHNNIALVCKGQRKTAGGFHWEYIDSELKKQGIQIREQIEKNKDNKKMPIMCVETGQVYESIREASRQTGISRSGLNSALSKETSTAYGYHWRYVNEKEN